MEYKGLVELNREIPTRGKYTKIAQQAIAEFQDQNIRTAKLDINSTNEQELKTLYSALKSLIRRQKIPVKATIQKDKTTDKHEIYLIHQNP